VKIFLGDLVHTWEKKGVWTMPLNIGFVASYAISKDENLEFRLFKDPENMIEAIRAESPDIVGLAHYVWNVNLNEKVFQVAKSQNRNILTVGGGPCFTSQNSNKEDSRQFFKKQKHCDMYVINQGERGFFEIISKFSNLGLNLLKMKSSPTLGCLTNNIIKKDEVLVGDNIDPLDDLNQIPSPYLTGIMDKFFDGPYIPIIETNRSCPYRCTFCAWGIGTTKLKKFEEDRINSEIEYIYKRCKNATTLFIADANFGILERDIAFAEKIYTGHQETGYPNHVAVQWSKGDVKKVLKTAEAFRDIAPIGASLQSMSKDVLGVIKRRNLPIEKISEFQKNLLERGQGGKLFSELIIGLPLETKESHIAANRDLINIGAEIWNYNLHLLPGTEMDSSESREKYFKKTGWRLHDNAFGIYDGDPVFEGQEVVLETSTLQKKDFSYFRFFHFLQQFMWSKRWYHDYLVFLKDLGFHPVEVFDRIIAKCQEEIGEIPEVYGEFMNDYGLESFGSFEDLSSFWEESNNFNRLRSGNYGKLNMLYTYKIILEHRKSFDKFLMEIASEYILENNKNYETSISICEDILRFQSTMFVKINDWEVCTEHIETFSFDILSWRLSKETKAELFKNKVKYRFFIDESHQKVLDTQLRQFKSENINSALRNMTVYTDSNQFFYSVDKAKEQE
jgi:radical SAM superfamily enzyme YgiQ (UPF0313 family)